MTLIHAFTGNAGPGIATAAAASALHSAAQGRRTLLLSLGPAAALGALLGASVGSATPGEVAPGCDALAIDGLAELASAWERNRGQLPSGAAAIAGDELPLPPGLEMVFGLLRLRELAPRYEVVVLDAGPFDTLLRAMAAPDGLRWAVRLLFGLDRGPGRSPASLGRALLPTTFIPPATFDGVQNARVRVEQLRELLLGPGAVACFVLRPDMPALEEARVAIPAIQLHGLAVATIAVGPLLPADLGGTSLAGHAAAQAQLLAEARASWPARPLQPFELLPIHGGRAALERVGSQIGPLAAPAVGRPIANEWAGAPAIAIELPGLPKHALQLTLSGDELIVRVGAFRRHILLPERLRGAGDIRATREGDHLVVRRRV